MNDDEFFSQFPIEPRPKFVEALRTKLVQLERSDEGEPMIELTHLTKPPGPLPQPRKHRATSRTMPVVAALLLVLFLGAALLINTNQAETELRLALIKPETGRVSLHRVAQLGKGTAYDAIWSPDGKQLVVPGSAGVWIYDANDLTKPLYNIHPELSAYTSLVFSGDSRFIAFISDKKIYMWDLVTQQDIPLNMPGMPPATAITLTTNGGILALASVKGEILFYDTQASVQLSETSDFIGTVFLQLQFNPSGTQLVFFGEETGVSVANDPSGNWDDKSLFASVKIFTIGSDEAEPVQKVNYSPDGAFLAARVGASVIIWDAETGKQINHYFSSDLYPTDFKKLINIGGDLTFSPDGHEIVGVDTRLITRWGIDAANSRLLMAGHDYTSVSVHLKPDLSTLSLVLPSGLIQFYDMTIDEIMGQRSDQITATISNHTLGQVYNVAFSPDGQQVASTSEGQQLLLWNTQENDNTSQPLLLLNGYQSEAFGFGLPRVIFSPDSRFVTTHVQNGVGEIQLWNKDGTPEEPWSITDYELKPGPRSSGSLSYSADGTRLLSTPPYSNLVLLWDTTTGKVIQTFDMYTVGRVSFATLSPDGVFVAVGLSTHPRNTYEVIAIYDANTGKPVKQFNAHTSEIRKLVYSPDGKSLISSAIDGSVYLWNLETEEIAYTLLKEHGNSAMAFSPDGRLILGVDTTGPDLIVWDAATGEILVRQPEIAQIPALAFSGDGTRLATGLSNGTIQIWGLETPR